MSVKNNSKAKRYKTIMTTGNYRHYVLYGNLVDGFVSVNIEGARFFHELTIVK